MTRFGWKQRLLCNSQDLNAGTVLVTVLAVMVILLLLFLAAFTFVANRYSYNIREQNKLVAKNLSEVGLTRWLEQLSQNQLTFDSLSFESPNGGKISATLSAWGPYALVSSKGMYANQEVTSHSVIGSRPNNLFQAAITVADESLPLVASGDTRIIGDVNSGELGLTTGRMRGESIVNEEFHTGNVIIRQSISVPRLDSVVLNQYYLGLNDRKLSCQHVLSGSVLLTATDSAMLVGHECIAIENNLRMQSVKIGETEKIRSFFVSGFVELAGNCSLSGLIEIISSGPIYVRDSVVADNLVLLTTDSIIISGNASFSATAISSKKIVVKDRARLLYPSLLLIRDTLDVTDFEPGIFLQSRGKMESVCYAERNTDAEDHTTPVIYLDSTSSFFGIIVAQSKTDLRGTVYGSVYTERFHYFASPTTYVNWMKDFHIDRTKLNYLPTLPMLKNSNDSNSFSVLRSDYLP